MLHRWQIDALGRQHLRHVEVPLTRPGPGQVLVRTEAVSLNYRDLLLTDGRFGFAPGLPFVPCSDLAGTVVAVGADVAGRAPGERVISTFLAGWRDGAAPADAVSLGHPGPGVLASHVVLPASWVVSAPASLDAIQASTLPCAALTAWFSLVELGSLHAGQTVLVHGTGGVALFGLQFARLHGAQAIVVSGAADKREQALALGARHAVARDGDWVAEVRRLTAGRGADHVLETVGGANLGRSLEAVGQGGRVFVIGVIDGGDMHASAFQAIGQRATLQGVNVGHRLALERMIRAIDANAVAPVVAAVYDADDVPAAFAHLERGPFGKVVVRF